MTATGEQAGLDGPTSDAMLKLGRFFTKWDQTADGRAVFREGGRKGDVFYRDRWSHDKVVRSTHGVNCTGSCSWKVYVKDGIITWESQQTDYPSVGADSPEYEPRGCPRGAAFSWYTYSPTRVRFPYARGVLVEMYREAKARLKDPVLAWADVVGDPERRRRYQQARGKGGLVRVSWQEAIEMAAAAHVHTIKTYGPDRCSGFSPIPAMSMVSHAVGNRFIQLIGGVMTSFYDWYADLPVASPQVFGDQTDVPESGDWWDSTYLMMWGSNVPVTRTPDAHWMTEVRYRGTKVVSVSPDYADNTKFADEWLPAQAGTDAALAMAMGHVMLKEFFVDRQVPYFSEYVRRYTDLPFLVRLQEHDGGGLVPSKFLTAADLPTEFGAEDAAFRTVLFDRKTGRAVVPNGSMGFRYNESGKGKWNLDLEGVDPALTLLGLDGGDSAEVLLPCFEDPAGAGSVLRRGVPVLRVDGHLVTTVFDLMLAQYGVGRDGLPGDWAAGYDDASTPYTPAWQEEITSVPAQACIRVAREFARNAEQSQGRSMIIMGAGICQWFHGDATYRAVLAMVMLTGCMGRNGGGWAHYVGQEKTRPTTGWVSLANALDWARPPRTMIGTGYWYMHTDQWRQDGYSADALKSPLSSGSLDGMHTADALAQSARLGWMPFYPQFDRNPLDIADEAEAAVAAGQAGDTPSYIARALKDGTLKPAIEDVDAPENWPRTLVLWRSNLLGSSAKGNEYFLRNLLGTHNNVMGKDHAEGLKPRDVKWHEHAPEGKLDLLVSADFRMTSTTLLSDIVFPAATWYEKHDLSSTDMHPFVHAFTPAIDPPWETKSDFETFHLLAEELSRQAKTHLGTRRDLVSVPLQHDTARTGGPARRRGPGLAPAGHPGGAGAEHARLFRGGAGLHGHRGQTRRRRSAGGQTGLHGQEHHLQARWCAEPAQPRQRGDARRGCGRQARHRHRRQAGRGDPGVLRYHQRGAGGAGVQGDGNPDRPETGGPGGGLRGEVHYLRPDPGRPRARDHLPGMVRLRIRRPALLPLHHQCGTAQALAHADRPDALLPGPRLDARHRGGAADLPAAAGHAAAVRRTEAGPERHQGGGGALPDPALEVVHPLRIPGQPADALPLPRRTHGLDEPGGRGFHRSQRQRLG